MNKQLVLGTLREALDDTKRTQRKLRALLRDQYIDMIDAPYGLTSALERLEHFRDDIRNALDEIK